MNDNEGVAEMLIESMGTTIVNTTDSKGRWEIKTDVNYSRLYCLECTSANFSFIL